MKYILIIISLVFVAGCADTGTDSLGGYSGVRLQASISPQNPLSEEPTVLTIPVSNEGDFDASNIKIEVLGLSNWAGLKIFEIDELEKSLQNEIVGIDEIVETLNAPRVPAGNPVTYNATARLTYKYSTIGNANINAINEDEYRLRRRTDTTENFEETITSNTRGPIQISIEKRQPIITETIPQNSKEKIEETIIINARNIGNGNPFYSDSKNPEPNSGNIHKVKLSNVVITTGSDSVEIRDDCLGDLTLNSATKSARKSCTFRFNDTKTSEYTLNVQAELDYYYLEEVDFTATVYGEDF